VALRAFAGGAFFGEGSGSEPWRVLALPGWGRRGADFAPALAGLDYLALDLPGFGSSPPPASALGSEDYAAVISPLLEVLAPDPVVVGHSFGGRVAVMLAARHPDRIRGLVLAAVPLIRVAGRPRTPLGYRWGRWAHRRGLIQDSAMEELRQRYGSPDYRRATGTMRATLVKVVNESYEEQLAGLRVPVHLLWGGADTEVPLQVAKEAEAILQANRSNVTLEVLEGVGHWLPTEDPQRLRAAVDRMLERG
jgi:pimeloyl-ACP methyl ester carboxylesterase